MIRRKHERKTRCLETLKVHSFGLQISGARKLFRQPLFLRQIATVFSDINRSFVFCKCKFFCDCFIFFTLTLCSQSNSKYSHHAVTSLSWVVDKVNFLAFCLFSSRLWRTLDLFKIETLSYTWSEQESMRCSLGLSYVYEKRLKRVSSNFKTLFDDRQGSHFVRHFRWLILPIEFEFIL